MATNRVSKRTISAQKVPKASSAVKKEPANAFFPKIYRFITEWWKIMLTSFVSGLIVIAIILQSLSLYGNYKEQQRLRQERGQVEKDLVYWKNSLTKYKDSRDIYFKVATLEYRLGNLQDAKSYLSKALEIDPNFEKGRVMEKQLEL